MDKKALKTAAIASVAFAAVGTAGALTYRAFRKLFPKPHAVEGKNAPLSVEKLEVPYEDKMLYGLMLRPKDREGKLPTVICSHGFNSSYQYFNLSVGRSLAMSGFAVYCFDFYGGSMHGKSGGKMTEMSVFDEREQLDAVIDRIKQEPYVDTDNLFLIGESQGGFVTAITAGRHNEDVRAVVLFYPAFCIQDDMRKRFDSVDDVPETVKVFGATVGRHYYEGLFDFDLYAEIAKYEGPVLVIHGDGDTIVDVSYGVTGAETYKDAELEILPGEEHGFSAEGKTKATELSYRFFKKHMSP